MPQTLKTAGDNGQVKNRTYEFHVCNVSLLGMEKSGIKTMV